MHSDRVVKVTSAAAIGDRLRARREQRKWRQEDLAGAMRTALHPWERVTVAAVEGGSRSLTATEQAALCGIFQRPWHAFLELEEGEHFQLEGSWWPPADVAIETSGGTWVKWGSFVEALRDGGRLEWGSLGGPEFTFWGPDETDRKAAKSLDVSSELVRTESLRLWGRSLATERDFRLRAHPNQTPRSVQALRGHITRALLRELRDHLK